MKYILLSLIFAASLAWSQPNFDGEKAFFYLEKQCEFGPRVPGTKGHAECKDYLISTLGKYADTVTTQEFMFSYGQPRRSATGANIIGRFAPEDPNRIILCAHWDTRPWADSDPNPANHTKPVLGANDGASGVAVLLHMAELFAEQPPAIGIDIVFFDAEDAGTHNNNESWALGSKAFAREELRKYNPRYAILLDMVGDRDLRIPQEYHSLAYAPQLVEKVWGKAVELGVPEFVFEVGPAVYDDHIPLLQAGVPAIDIIDFDYPTWHTVNDAPEYCSSASLQAVGRVVTAVVYEE